MMTTNADVMNELANAAQSATRMTEEVEGKVEEINEAIAELKSQSETTAQGILNNYQDPLDVKLYVSNTGDDNNAGNSPENSLKTIGNAVSRVKTGAVLTISIKGDGVFTLDEDVIPKGVTLKIELGVNTILEQGITALGKPATITPSMGSEIYISGGVIRTSIDESTRSKDTAFIKRSDSNKTQLSIFYVGIELGNHDLFSCGQTANPMHSLGIGHSQLSMRASGNSEGKLAQVLNSNLSLTIVTVTNNTGISITDLVTGIVRDANENPINLLSNIAI